MPQSKKNENLRKLKIKEKIHQIVEKQAIQTEHKIIQALKMKPLTFSQLIKETKLSRGTINKYLRKLLQKGEIFKILDEKGNIVYSLIEYPQWLVFQDLAISYLHHNLRNEPIEVFNQKLGSLITYTLKQYQEPLSIEILTPIISQISAYINLPKTFMGEPLKISEPKVESKEWQVWRDIDSRNYVTKVEILEKGFIIRKEAVDYAKFKEKWLKGEHYES
jgi:predicted transcriptional regulator